VTGVRVRDWPLAVLAFILVVTASWWALALWPVGPEAPQWFLRTRDVCFGATAGRLPNAGGWLLLIGQPFGMIATFAAVWPAELRSSLDRLRSGAAGQVGTGLVAAAIIAGVAGVAMRIAHAGGETFAVGENADPASELVRLSNTPPAMALIDQQGRAVSLETFRGRPVLVTFAYAHCDTVCPMVVAEALAAQAITADLKPALLVITLDPWRDTPSRLDTIAVQWRMTGDARVLSGSPDEVDRVLSAWRVPRARNERTGELSHPAMVYVIDRDGRIAYAIGARADVIAGALRAL